MVGKQLELVTSNSVTLPIIQQKNVYKSNLILYRFIHVYSVLFFQISPLLLPRAAILLGLWSKVAGSGLPFGVGAGDADFAIGSLTDGDSVVEIIFDNPTFIFVNNQGSVWVRINYRKCGCLTVCEMWNA